MICICEDKEKVITEAFKILKVFNPCNYSKKINSAQIMKSIESLEESYTSVICMQTDLFLKKSQEMNFTGVSVKFASGAAGNDVLLK